VTTPIDTSLFPADVRAAGKSAVQTYATALQFEQMLTQQLAQGLVDDSSSADDSGDDSDGTDGTDGTSAIYQQQLPDALAQSVTGAGGLGLARTLYDAIERKP
jgi:hypothetical protein